MDKIAQTRCGAPSARLLTVAPHRLLFFVGATNVLLAMVWWTVWLMAVRWQWFAVPRTIVPAGWMHAIVMQYQMLPPFMFGFLITVFPRWMALPPLTRNHYVPVGVALLGGQLITLTGLWGVPHLLFAGLLLTLAGWLTGLLFLLNLLRQDRQHTWHARSCALALLLGVVGLALVLAYLRTFDARLMLAAIKIGSFGLLLPVFFTVNHRMTPFFAAAVLPTYRVVRPMWSLAVFWILALGHLALALAHRDAWLWLTDVPMAALTGWLLWQWYPRHQSMPALLRVLFVAFAWLPVAFALFACQSLWLAISGEFLLGRAPTHALFIGYFGSLLVAMVTRVTQGHSGRLLELGPVAGFAFLLLQGVAVVRIIAELRPDPLSWQAVAAAGWLLAFTPWVLRSAWTYLTPRIDGNAG